MTKQKTRIPWQELKQKYILSQTISIKDFLVQEGILKPKKDLPGGYITKTKGWKEDKLKFWKDKFEKIQLDPEVENKLQLAVFKAVDAFASAFLHYSNQIEEKIKKGKEIKLDEIIRLGEFIKKYHQLDLNSENEHKLVVELSGDEKKLMNKLLKIKK